MVKMRRSDAGLRRILVAIALIYCIVASGWTLPVASQSDTTNDDWSGPYLDRIRYILFNGSYPGASGDPYRAQVLALLDGEIDALTTDVHEPVDRLAVEEASDIELVQFYRTAAIDLRFNCECWPFNISAFRRAIHYAVDKDGLNAIQGGLSQDSQIIPAHPLSVENDLEHHYYEPEVAEGAALLDSLGFTDIDHDGWREAPNGEDLPPLEVKYLQISIAGPMAAEAADSVVDALNKLNVSAYSTRIYDYDEALDTYYNRDYMMFTGFTHAYEFNLEEWITQWRYNTKAWTNATFNSYADLALSSLNYDEIANVIKQMQYIMIEDCPNIVLIQIPLFNAYRTDCLENITEHPCGGATTFFTGLTACNSTENATGGCLRIGMSSDIIELPSYTNPNPSTYYWLYHDNLMGMMHDSLCKIDPNLDVINWLLDEVTIEGHDDDSSIPEGHTRISLDIVDNAFWSDGTAIKTSDVSFSINWFRENHPDGQQALGDLIYCAALSPDLLQLEFRTQTFWNFYKICFLPIIPAHKSNQYAQDLITTKMSPVVFNENLVVSGPFMASEQVPGEYIELVQNPYYWKNPKNIPIPMNDTTATTPPFSNLTMPLIAGAIGAASVILVGGVLIQKKLE